MAKKVKKVIRTNSSQEPKAPTLEELAYNNLPKDEQQACDRYLATHPGTDVFVFIDVRKQIKAKGLNRGKGNFVQVITISGPQFIPVVRGSMDLGGEHQ